MFSRDTQSRQALNALANDWRFARVEVEALEGDVESAIDAFQKIRSPDLVIVQTDQIDDEFIGRLEALSDHCQENTNAIVVGPVNDVNLYRRLVTMGVSDYLVRPLNSAQLAEDIAATLLTKIGTDETRLIAMIGAKGGAGVSTMASGLAWALATKYTQKTFLMDAAGGWSSLSVGIGFEPATTLVEAARAAQEGNDDSLTRMVHQAHERLFILSSGGDSLLDGAVGAQEYEALLSHMMTTYPVIIVDLSASSPEVQRAVLARAHKILLFTTPLLPSVRSCRTLLTEIKSLRGGHDDNVEVVLNMQSYAPKNEVPKAQIEQGLDRKLSAMIKFDPETMVRIESQSLKMHEDKGGQEMIEKILPLILPILKTPHDGAKAGAGKQAGLGQLLGKIKRKG